jgi:hypothetical protein
MEFLKENNHNLFDNNVISENFPSILIFEMSAHNHVVANMVKLCGESCVVFTLGGNVEALRETLAEYGLRVIIKDWRYGSEILKRKSIRKKAKVIVTTWHEAALTRAKLVLCLRIIRANLQVLCVRNGFTWSIKSRHSLKKVPRGLIQIKLYLLDLISFLLNRFLILRATLILVESKLQFDFLKALYLINHRKLQIFPGRLTDFTPIENANFKLPSNTENELVIGLLGTCNASRRDMHLVIEVIANLQKSNHLRVIWLGGVHNAITQQALIEAYPKLSIMFPVKTVWSESEFVTLSSYCHALISPLNDKWGYQCGMSTGSLADALLLKRKIFFPDFINFGPEFDDIVSYYESAHDLCQQVQSTSGKVITKIPSNIWILLKFSTENMKKLILA